VLKLQQLLKEFKDVFAWTYKDVKVIQLELALHRIELDITTPPTHQPKYKLNPNYATTIKSLQHKRGILRSEYPRKQQRN
jgi:hypothetical protein